MNMIRITTFIFPFLFCLSTAYAWGQPKIIAHRGFWKTEGSAQNSLAALAKADSLHCYGSEFDVWLSADGQLVVNHDRRFRGRTMETSTFNELTALQLDNGESLPSLKAYLEKAKEHPHLKLILELKKHRTPEKETQAVTQIINMVNQFGLADRTEYISFSLHVTKEFIRLAPGVAVYYLNGELSPKELKDIGCAGLDYSWKDIRKHPGWINEAHRLGLKVNVWTVNKEDDMRWLIKQGVDFITTNEPLLLQSLLKEYK